MIHLHLKDINNPPARLISERARRQLKTSVSNQDGRITSTYYGNTEVRDLLRAYSIHKLVLAASDKAKCNYCEAQAEHAVTLQVEHFRPKATVDVRDTNGLPHSGYYWLALEWSNLLLSCPNCNGKGAKGTRFPIAGLRCMAMTPVDDAFVLNRNGCFADQHPLLAEEALLIHPELDRPEEFLTFNVNGEMMGHGPQSLRGETTKDVLNLNRPALVSYRLAVWDTLKIDILMEISEYEVDHGDINFMRLSFRRIAKRLIKRKLPSEEFTLWGRYINEHLEAFISIDIPPHYQQDFREEYAAALVPVNR